MKRIFILGLFVTISCVSHGSYASVKASSADSKRGIESSPAVEGVLIDFNLKKKFLNISTSAGGENIILINKNTMFIKAGKAISLSDLLPGDRLEIIYNTKRKKRIAKSVQVKSSSLVPRKYYANTPNIIVEKRKN